MGHGIVVTLVIFFGLFLILISILRPVTRKISFPYTVALLILGFLLQFLEKFAHDFLNLYFNLNLNVVLPTNVIFFVLLPILLFEAALNISFHQFRKQFKTISFISTFGLMLSIMIIGFGLSTLAGLPMGVALLFGAMISATDPIAVLALFKTLGVPKRLSLLADGESMFNDASAVIAFRVILGIVIGEEVLQQTSSDPEAIIITGQRVFDFQSFISGFGTLPYVFIGSIIYGSILAYIVAKVIEKIKEDYLVENTLTLALALFSFSSAEHFFGLSGVISCVISGIVMGNLGRTKFSGGVTKFIEEFWEYLGFIAVSVIFFFAAYNLDLLLLLDEPLRLLIVVFIVLSARSISVYLTFFFTNKLSFFRDEPNVPLSWQHIINWGGLRGVIPLVLVFTIPDGFVYKQDLIAFTFATILFTLFINGTTIKWLLIKLKLHLPVSGEAIIAEEVSVFKLAKARKILRKFSGEFDEELISREEKFLLFEEKKHKAKLMKLAKPKEFLFSLRIESLDIEKQTLKELFYKGYINENVYHIFDAELDMQKDRLEFPELYKNKRKKDNSLRKRTIELRLTLLKKFPILKKIFSLKEEDIIEERFALLKARVITSTKVIENIDSLKEFMIGKKACLKVIEEVKKNQQELIERNNREIKDLSEKYPKTIKNYNNRLIQFLVWDKVDL